MAKTIVGLYEDFHAAEQVVKELVDSGFERENISIAARDQNQGRAYTADKPQGEASHDTKSGEHAAAGAGTGAVLGGLAGLLVGLGALAIPGVGPIIAAGPLAATLAGAGIGAAAGGLIGALTGAGVPEEDAHAYAEGVRQGGTLVMVKSPDDRAEQAADIMNRFDPIDVDTRYGEHAGPETAARRSDLAETSSTRDFNETDTTRSHELNTEGEQHIPIVEEDMAVGKREVNRGGVRVRSYVTERPFEETHHVRDESVNVERRPANRPLAAGDLDNAFQEQTFEVNETDEELVVDKRANVVEDVVVSKNVEERPETVRDTLRRTEVETENLGGTTMRGSRDFNSSSDDFHNHYETAFGGRGRDYSYYQPAYRYGYDLAGNQRYRGRKWSEIEADARRDWERSHQGSSWDEFRDSVRYGWERASSGMQDTGPTGGTFTGESDQGYAAGAEDRF